MLRFEFAAILFASTFCAHAARANVVASDKPVHWEELKSFRFHAPFWLTGADASGNVLALYDLSYPTLRGRILLGKLEDGALNRQNVLRLLEATLEGPAKLADPQRAMTLTAVETFKAMPTTAVLPSGWWKTVPWKKTAPHSEAFAVADVAPSSFRLSDFDWAVAMHRSQELVDQLNRIDPDFLEHIAFTRTDSNGYEIYYDAPDALDAALQTPDTAADARKIADLRCVKCGLYETLGWQGASMAIGFLLGEIKIPVLSGLLNAAFTEFFTFRARLISSHQSMALEMLQAAAVDDATSSFIQVGQEDRDTMVESITYARSSLYTAIRWAWEKPLTVWGKQETKADKQVASSVAYLNKHGSELELLTPRFGTGHEGHGQRVIFSLGTNRYFDVLPPFVAINYDRPKDIFAERIAIEAAHALLQMIKPLIPVPGVGAGLGFVFDFALENEMHKVQDWESRLYARLSATPDNRQQSWDFERHLLFLQQVNPFEVSPDAAAALVSARRATVAGLAD